jgi:hypothetical protein
MQTKRILSVLGVLSAASLGGLLLSFADSTVQHAQASPGPNTKIKTTAALLAGYKKWTKVNPKPQRVESYLMLLCAPATPEMSAKEKTNPHNDKFITVFVNVTGRKALMEQKLPRFPEGSVIIKEKLTAEDSTKPELMTIMRKREKGYNPTHGDWEYLVTDGAGKQIQAAGKLDNCQKCHIQWKAGDYVSRRYLPYTLRERLR